MRSHLHRVAKICSNTHAAAKGLRKLGKMLAKREHPLSSIITSFERLRPCFLAEIEIERYTFDQNAAMEITIFGEWEPKEVAAGLHLSGTVPFLGTGRNEQAKRITGTFLNDIAKSIICDEPPSITVNNTPFKSIGRSLPNAKIMPPVLLDNELVGRTETGGPPDERAFLGQKRQTRPVRWTRLPAVL